MVQVKPSDVIFIKHAQVKSAGLGLHKVGSGEIGSVDLHKMV